MPFFEIECVGISAFLLFWKTTRRICANFFQALRENTCSLQSAMKHIARPFRGRL